MPDTEPTEAAGMTWHWRPDGFPAVELFTEDNRRIAHRVTPTEALHLARLLIGWTAAVLKWPDMTDKYLDEDERP